MDNINIELLPNSILDRKKHQIYINPCNYMKPTMWGGTNVGFIFIPSELEILNLIKTNSAILTIQKFVSRGSAVKKNYCKHNNHNNFEKLPPLIINREKNKWYCNKDNKIVKWDGCCLRCEHNTWINYCIFCIIPIIPKNKNERIKGKRYFNIDGKIVVWDGNELKYIDLKINLNNVTHTCLECFDKKKSICKICNIDGYLLYRMRSRLHTLLKKYKREKKEIMDRYNKETPIKYLGCDMKTFREYFEILFTEGMSWNKMGEIHIDHRKPCSSFDLSKDEELKKCFHYTNLQPLWAKDNLSKSRKFDENSFLYKWCDIEKKWILKLNIHYFLMQLQIYNFYQLMIFCFYLLNMINFFHINAIFFKIYKTCNNSASRSRVRKALK